MTKRHRWSPYDAFGDEDVAQAERDMKLTRLARDLGRELTDEDVLIWLRSRAALEVYGSVAVDARGAKIGIVTKTGEEIWLTRMAAAALAGDLARALCVGPISTESPKSQP